MPPPRITELLDEFERSHPGASTYEMLAPAGRLDHSEQRYLSWDELRYRQPPDGLDHRMWWLRLKIARVGTWRTLALVDKNGVPFRYSLPDEILEDSEFVAANASGRISVSELVTNPATRDRYLVNSLIEEAVTSSQLEGAATSRDVAVRMLRSGRRPRDRSERMIVNNYLAMRYVGELREERLTPELLCEIHRIVTDGTLDDPDEAGRFQRPGDHRIAVYDDRNRVLHKPPAAADLPDRIAALCEFANGGGTPGYLPKVLRPLTLHFMVGYEHPFADGNGRTARAVFYWSMLREGFWLADFLSVSRILHRAPSKYARSFLLTESDDNDLTYFYGYHLKVLRRAIGDLHEHLRDKMRESQHMRELLARSYELFNHRQLALVQNALDDPVAVYTVQSHRRSHRTSTETARQDLAQLVDLGLLAKVKRGKRFEFQPSHDLEHRIRSLRRARRP